MSDSPLTFLVCHEVHTLAVTVKQHTGMSRCVQCAIYLTWCHFADHRNKSEEAGTAGSTEGCQDPDSDFKDAGSRTGVAHHVKWKIDR